MLRNASYRRPAYVLGGRLIYERPCGKFSWLRCGVITSVIAYLYVTNSANHHRHKLIGSITSRKNNDSVYSNAYEKRRTTDFAIFAVKERTIKATVSAGGFEISCPYDESILGSVICRDIIRKHLTHQKPLIYNSRDRVYTAHRVTAWLLISCALLSSCFTKPLAFKTDYVLVDSLASIFFNTDNSPLWSLAIKLLHLNTLIYPGLQAMDVTIQQQSSDSIFSLFKSTDANFAFSMAVMLWIAVVVNAGSKCWSGSLLLQFDAVTAAYVGYYAHYQSTTLAVDYVFSRFSKFGMLDAGNWNTLTWTILFIIFMRGSFTTAVFWCLTHCAGQIVSDYQYEHLAIVATARVLSNWIESAGHALEQGLRNLFGTPKRNQWMR